MNREAEMLLGYFIMEAETKTRRIIGIGKSRLITLPPAWWKKHGLKPGDRIGCVWDEVLILIVPKEK
jgi:hypothetical protein